MTALVPDLTVLNVLLFLAGLAIIVKGSDLFLDNAVWMAEVSGVPQVIVGATVVSLCTTLPELVSSCTAAFKGRVDMAFGNAVGSVICNTGLILGVLLIFMTVVVRREVFLVKGIFMLAALGTAFLLALPSGEAGAAGVYEITRLEGGAFLIFLVVYMVVNYFESIHVPSSSPIDTVVPGTPALPDKLDAVPRSEWVKRGTSFLAGAVLVGVGAYILVEFGQRLARNLGISEALISLVFVALGTSLPELFTAISAIRKKAQDVSIGNVFGANVLNLALVTGVSAVIQPLRFRDSFLARFDVPVALALGTVVFVGGVATGRAGRRMGWILLAGYALYLVVVFSMGRTQ